MPILVRAEPEFAEFYDDETGRPNRPVALVLGTKFSVTFSSIGNNCPIVTVAAKTRTATTAARTS